MLATEALLCVAALFAACVWPNQIARIAKHAALTMDGIATRRSAATLVVFLLAVVARLATLPIEPIPVPTVGDEFSYLLMADTFAHGRLANPPHAMWEHLETFHVNQHPVYVSKYYPGQGLFLAVGQVLFGNPFWGVVLSTALMCAGICWMLQEWVTPGWAFVGGILAVIRIATFSYWNNSYYGGSVTALGGALALGAAIRLWKYHRVRDGAIMAAGFGLLFGTRPYESLWFFIPILFAGASWAIAAARKGSRSGEFRALATAAIGFALIVAAMSFYFWRTSGSPFASPYMLNRAEYERVPIFPWLKLPPKPDYRHAAIGEGYWDWELERYEFSRSHPVEAAVVKSAFEWRFFFGPALSIPVFALLFALPGDLTVRSISRDSKFLLSVGLSVAIAVGLYISFTPHYMAPITCVVYWCVVCAMRYVSGWKPSGKNIGYAVVALTVALCIALVPIRTLSKRLGVSSESWVADWASPVNQLKSRAEIASRLNRETGQQLVLVHYGPNHYAPTDWVYNSADIDKSKVVWARDMGYDKNAEIIKYFPDRKVWLVEPDANPALVLPYERH